MTQTFRLERPRGDHDEDSSEDGPGVPEEEEASL